MIRGSSFNSHIYICGLNINLLSNFLNLLTLYTSIKLYLQTKSRIDKLEEKNETKEKVSHSFTFVFYSLQDQARLPEKSHKQNPVQRFSEKNQKHLQINEEKTQKQ